MKHPEVGQIPLNQKIRAVAFSRDERFLATAGNDHSARLWPLRAEDLIAEACCRLGLPQARELPGQCQSYVAGLDPNVLCPPDLPPPPFCPARRP
jgi:WD40 repeat protein